MRIQVAVKFDACDAYEYMRLFDGLGRVTIAAQGPQKVVATQARAQRRQRLQHIRRRHDALALLEALCHLDKRRQQDEKRVEKLLQVKWPTHGE